MNVNRILLIEDERRAGMDLARELRAEGCTVYGPYLSVEKALKVLKERTFDAGIIDIQNAAGATVMLADLAAFQKPFVILSDLPAGAIPEGFRDQQQLPRHCSAEDIFTAFRGRSEPRRHRWSRWASPPAAGGPAQSTMRGYGRRTANPPFTEAVRQYPVSVGTQEVRGKVKA